MRGYTLVFALLAALTIPSRAGAEESRPNPIRWQSGPTTGAIGSIAEVDVPPGYLFADKPNTLRIIEITENISNGHELAAIVPRGEGDTDQWIAYFEFRDVGYVKDDDKNQIDADKLLESIRQGTEDGNAERRKRGWDAIHVVGWSRPPYYDERTKNLTWGLELRSDSGGVSINHSIRILGRHGTVNVDFVLDPQYYEATMPRFDSLLAGFRFREGNRYADFVKGDKVATFGLAALVAGGAGAAAVKTGLLAKLGKFLVVLLLGLKKLIIVVIIAIGAFLKRIGQAIRRLFGGGNVESVETTEIGTPSRGDEPPATGPNDPGPTG